MSKLPKIKILPLATVEKREFEASHKLLLPDKKQISGNVRQGVEDLDATT